MLHNKIYCIPIVRYATMWVDAENKEQAKRIARKYAGNVPLQEYAENGAALLDCEEYHDGARNYMGTITLEDGTRMSASDFIEAYTNSK